MAFPAHARKRLKPMSQGDMAIIYVTRGAFGNPPRDAAYLAGIAEVLGPVDESGSGEIAGRAFPFRAPIQIHLLFGDHAGPKAKPLIEELSFVKRPSVWGQYFRNSPIEVSEADFSVMADVLHAAKESRPE